MMTIGVDIPTNRIMSSVMMMVIPVDVDEFNHFKFAFRRNTKHLRVAEDLISFTLAEIS